MLVVLVCQGGRADSSGVWEQPYAYCNDNGIELYYTVTDVARKKDLQAV